MSESKAQMQMYNQINIKINTYVSLGGYTKTSAMFKVSWVAF